MRCLRDARYERNAIDSGDDRSGGSGARQATDAASHDDDGAAVVEFVLISVLLIFLLFAVLQVAVFFYARNIVSASAADAARYAAASGVDPGAGGPRAERLIAQGLGSAGASGITCSSAPSVDPDSGLPVTTVRCSGHVRAVLAPLDLPLRVQVTTSALREATP